MRNLLTRMAHFGDILLCVAVLLYCLDLLAPRWPWIPNLAAWLAVISLGLEFLHNAHQARCGPCLRGRANATGDGMIAHWNQLLAYHAVRDAHPANLLLAALTLTLPVAFGVNGVYFIAPFLASLIFRRATVVHRRFTAWCPICAHAEFDEVADDAVAPDPDEGWDDDDDDGGGGGDGGDDGPPPVDDGPTGRVPRMDPVPTIYLGGSLAGGRSW